MMYIFLLSLLVLQTLVVAESLALNVRTALFTPADLAKKRWNRRDVALLRARMYLQRLVPPMEVSQSPEYVRSIARYIENCYDSVAREAFDSETETILTVAVSDVLGGYLKMVALPVTKNAYYNGDLTTQDALILFKYYDDIKEQLGTNGRGWSNQLTNIAKTNNIRGIRSETSLTKIKNPCQRLYLRSSQDNVTMPMPSIDWKTRMMFLPLTNQPIVDLRSPYIGNILKQFHQIATACERSIAPERRLFQGSFEDWVNEAVLPHLSDDDLYTAFKGILCLIENTNLMSVPTNCTPGFQFYGNIFHSMSKKTIIIVSILTLELICCIPTLLYCVLKKKKSKEVSDTNRFPSSTGSASSKINVDMKRVGYCDKTVFYELSSQSSSFHSQHKLHPKESYNSYNKFMINEVNSDLSTVSVSRRSYSSITDAATATDEAPVKKYSKKEQKILPISQHFHYKHTETDKINVSQNQTQVSKWALLPRKTSTSTAINLNTRTSSRNDTSNDTGETITLSTVLPQEKSVSKTLRKSKRFRPRHVIESLTPDTYNPFPSRVSIVGEELNREFFENRTSDVPVMRLDSVKNVDFASPQVGITHTKNSEVSCNRSVKSLRSVSRKESVKVLDEHRTRMLESQDCTTSEKRIDKPRQRINAEVSKQRIPLDSDVMPKNRKGILKSGEEKEKRKIKISKIPKRTSSPVPHCDAPRPARREPEGSRRKSRIPKLDRALDDSAIHSATPRDRKLNVTL